MKCERCQQVKEEKDFNHGKEDSICERCCEEMLLGGSSPRIDHIVQMGLYWDFEKGDYKK